MPSKCRPPPPFTRIIDTGTSHHNLALGDGNPQDYVPYTTNAPQVMIPNGTNITACAKYNLKLPNVSEQASATDVLPTFRHSLISVGQLCDDGCTATFSKHGCTVYNKNKKPVLTGSRNPTTGLYEQDMIKRKNKHQSATFKHSCLHCSMNLTDFGWGRLLFLQNTLGQSPPTLPRRSRDPHLVLVHERCFCKLGG